MSDPIIFSKPETEDTSGQTLMVSAYDCVRFGHGPRIRFGATMVANFWEDTTEVWLTHDEARQLRDWLTEQLDGTTSRPMRETREVRPAPHGKRGSTS